MDDDIQKQGAQAARDGAKLLDCPFLKPEAMPSHTGEAPAIWRSKFEAWQAGWIAETKVRRRTAADSQDANHKHRN